MIGLYDYTVILTYVSLACSVIAIACAKLDHPLTVIFTLLFPMLFLIEKPKLGAMLGMLAGLTIAAILIVSAVHARSRKAEQSLVQTAAATAIFLQE